MTNADDDSQNWECGACGAEPGEECRPGCLGKAKADDESDE